MILDYEVVKLIWWLAVGVLFVGFAVTDGMDVGVGTLLPWLGKNDDERRVIINTVGPHRDGKQVWLITAGGAIFAAWPLVYATAFSGFYFAMLLALFALFFRPVGFDYRSKISNPVWRSAWDWELFMGGAVPALVFGIAFDIDGFRVVSMPATDAIPNPLTKEVVIESGAWRANYPTYPLTLLFPIHGFAGLGLAVFLSMKDRPGMGLIMSGPGITGIIMTAGAAMFPFIMPSSSNPQSSLIAWDANSSDLTPTVMSWAAVIFISLILIYTSWTCAMMWRRVTVEEDGEQDTLAYCRSGWWLVASGWRLVARLFNFPP